MRAFLIVVLVACGSSSPIGSQPPTGQPLPKATAKSGRIRVMTYNVNFGLDGDRAGVEAVASGSPDLVLFQETTPAWQTALVAGLGARLPHHHFEPTSGPWAAGGMGVMSRWPIVTIERLDGGEPFFAQRVVIDAPGGRLQLLNVHLRPPMSDGGSWIVGYFSTREIREREIRRHLARLDQTMPTIVAGDFNEQDDGLAIGELVALGFTSALSKFYPDALTWYWPVGSLTLRFRLDHVMYDGTFRAIAAGVIDRGRSDHFPVWADLEPR